MNLNEETRNGYTISSKMKEIWSMELQMTKLVLDVCKKYNLRIWVEGGTLLGTVRHQGFIPFVINDIRYRIKTENIYKNALMKGIEGVF